MNDFDEFAEVRASDPPDLAPDLSRANNQPATDREAHTSRHPTGKESRVARASRQQLASQVNPLDPSIHRWKRSSSRVVRDEFQEAAVGIPEVDADPLTLGLRPCIHGHHPESNGVMHLALAPLAKLASFG